ncbi:hypothetical protein [Metapseudomonas otitidis]|uniref:hypothetical protein n=1 Tax=Metapseudomonas otitidis TaxID=319939 RepID=UPI001F0EC581|nr:hypothetical protein [Pseudomonas otitidis]
MPSNSIIKSGEISYIKAGTGVTKETSKREPDIFTICRCRGTETSSITGYETISSYSGELPSPLKIIWYTPKSNEILKLSLSDSEIRKWTKEAAQYHGVPHILLAVILQQENGPKAGKFLQTLQFGERTLTTFLAIVDKYAFDIVPDKIAGSSSGLVNMSRNTLQKAAAYTEDYYCKKPMPKDVQYRIFGYDQDTRIPGDDWRADLYYAAAHLRELIDRKTNTRCHNSTLTPEQLKSVIAAYNGSGPLAEKYASDAMNLLEQAKSGSATLYFYET